MDRDSNQSSPFETDPAEGRSRWLPRLLLVAAILAALSFLLAPASVNGLEAYQSLQGFVRAWRQLLDFFLSFSQH